MAAPSGSTEGSSVPWVQDEQAADVPSQGLHLAAHFSALFSKIQTIVTNSEHD